MKWYQQVEIDGKRTTASTVSDELLRRKVLGMLMPIANKRILDVGCNAGAFLLGAWNLGAGACVGIERNKEFIQQAVQLRDHFGAPYNVLRMNVEKNDLSSLGVFDAVLLISILYHLNDPKKLLRQLITQSRCFIVRTRDDRLTKQTCDEWFAELGLKCAGSIREENRHIICYA